MASSTAPTAMRAAPTPRGEMSGPSARAVPVVPKSTAAPRTRARALEPDSGVGDRRRLADKLFNNSAIYRSRTDRATRHAAPRADPSGPRLMFTRQEPFRHGGLADVDRPFHRRPARRAQAPDRGTGRGRSFARRRR